MGDDPRLLPAFHPSFGRLPFGPEAVAAEELGNPDQHVNVAGELLSLDHRRRPEEQPL